MMNYFVSQLTFGIIHECKRKVLSNTIVTFDWGSDYGLSYQMLGSLLLCMIVYENTHPQIIDIYVILNLV